MPQKSTNNPVWTVLYLNTPYTLPTQCSYNVYKAKII